MSAKAKEKAVSSLENCSLMALKLEEKQQRQLIREKLRSRPPSRSGSRERTQNKGPMLARPMSPGRSLYSPEKSGGDTPAAMTKSTNSSSGSSGRSSPNLKTSSRGSSPVGSPKLSRAPSPRPGRPSSPSLSTRRGSSPQRQQSFLELAEHVLKKRVQRALHARLYLLQKTGPNSFLVGGDSPEHKYKVKIGEQNCNCSKGPFCIHLFFVMLRVFKVEENDAILWSRTLKDYEVENLFNVYERRREKSLQHTGLDNVSRNHSKDGNEGFLRFRKEYIEGDEDDEVMCPICLLAMSEGESLVTCQMGCFNTLHQHCMEVWAKECEIQKEELKCPLCRKAWKTPLADKQDKKPKQRKFVEKIRSRKSSQGDPTADTNSDTPMLERVMRDVNDPEMAQLTLERKREENKTTCERGTETSEEDLQGKSQRKGRRSENGLSDKKYEDRKGREFSRCNSCGTECSDDEVAVAYAMELSASQQDPLPFIPGLMPSEKDEDVIVCVQVDVRRDGKASNSQVDSSREYQENHQWVKGDHLGTGAFSTCYQVWDRATGTIMAVKQISFMRNSVTEQEKVAASITKEIELMASLDHPNVIRLLGATRQGCHFNMFLEWMPAGSVSNVLESYGAFEEPLILKYTRQVLKGLVYLHQRGVIHRDLKGANLLLDSTGHNIRIADLGTAAKMASQFTGTEEFKGQVLGTIAFMAPEVLRGETYGRSCDLWSLGCCLYEMATREPPWDASKISNSLQLIFRIASAKSPPPLPDHLSAELKDLILSCLQAVPSARPTSKELIHHSVFTEE
ncbi:uncharacterized protein [Apostichopus japonicus]|uniref:uncharacterized protein n=1 Tax=Stichopus japonicus TaxID=307972 RepID=UPI003AB87337